MDDYKNYVKDNERLDDLQCNGMMLIQNPSAFCFGMDAVLLANFVHMKKGQAILDLCSGNGIIPVLLAGKHPTCTMKGIEIQEAMAEMAVRSIKLNQIEERVSMVNGDLKEIETYVKAASFDAVSANPPYTEGSHGLLNPYEPKNIARHEICCNLEDVVRAATYALKPGGSFFMVHKPHRLVEIITCLKEHKLEPKRMRMVHPFADKEPNMVLIEAVRGGNPRILIEPPLIVYDAVNQYSEEIHRIYGWE